MDMASVCSTFSPLLSESYLLDNSILGLASLEQERGGKRKEDINRAGQQRHLRAPSTVDRCVSKVQPFVLSMLQNVEPSKRSSRFFLAQLKFSKPKPCKNCYSYGLTSVGYCRHHLCSYRLTAFSLALPPVQSRHLLNRLPPLRIYNPKSIHTAWGTDSGAKKCHITVTSHRC